jgi:SAM-dependent methyltransferase
MLAARLATIVPSVLGVDLHEEQVDAARARYPSIPGLSFATGDLLTFEGGPYDAVTCSATVHHLDLELALASLERLTAPGGTLVVVGLANDTTPVDRLRSLGVAIVNRIVRLVRGWHDHRSPRQDPRDSWSTVRETAERLLPGVVYRRRFYWRYTLVWHKPDTETLSA